MDIIKSKDNKLFKLIKKLKTKKYREKEQSFLAEGHKFLDFDNKPKYIILREDCYSSFIEKAKNLTDKVYIFSTSLFKELSTQEHSQGVLLIYDYIPKQLVNLSNNIVVLDRVQDPGNLGTIIRLTDAAGLKDIILTKGSVDLYNDKVVRSSMGSIFNLNINYIEEKELIDLLKEKGYKIIATTLSEKSIEYTSMKIKEKNALIFGNEGQGISKKLIEASDESIIIPIYGIAESLNVSVASSIIIYKLRELLNG